MTFQKKSDSMHKRTHAVVPIRGKKTYEFSNTLSLKFNLTYKVL